MGTRWNTHDPSAQRVAPESLRSSGLRSWRECGARRKRKQHGEMTTFPERGRLARGPAEDACPVSMGLVNHVERKSKWASARDLLLVT
jgi:hypothetical protein